MINLLLVCDQGFSTSMMETALKNEISKRNLKATVEAVGISALSSHIESADVVLFGPQVAYRMEEIKEKYPDRINTMYVMNPTDFALMEANKVLDEALKIIKENKNAR